MRLLLFAVIALMALQAQAKKFTILIDPGHGGYDLGTSHEGVMEKNLTLSVALRLYEMIKNNPHFEVQITRQNDKYISLDERVKKGEEIKADALVSIHANSSPIYSAKGPQIYFESQIPTDEESLLIANRENNIKTDAKEPDANDVKGILQDLGRSNHMTKSQLLAQEILENLQDELKIKTRAIRQAPFRVLTGSMPSTLLEMGFISNPKEALWLKEPATQKKIAQAIYNGLVDFKKKLDKHH
jgi:N-acetylmuramoyl-L-alanine amidase